MPELRRDPVLGRWVIIATERGKRPSDFNQESEGAKGNPASCPFCPGNEEMTPPEVGAVRPPGSQPDSAGWKLRVMPNKFPALRIEGQLGRQGVGLYDKMNGVGAHEVVVENPNHFNDLDQRELEENFLVYKAYRERIVDLSRDERFEYVLVFRNFGSRAGASLTHPHSQIIATPIIPKRVIEELQGTQQHYRFKKRCLFCDIIDQEQMLVGGIARGDHAVGGVHAPAAPGGRALYRPRGEGREDHEGQACDDERLHDQHAPAERDQSTTPGDRRGHDERVQSAAAH